MKRIIYSAAIAALLVTSCQKTDVLNVVEDAIEFGTEVGKLTKATSSYDDPKYATLVNQDFRVWAVADFTQGEDVEGQIYRGIDNLTVESGEETWGIISNKKYYWPQAGNHLYFYTISALDTEWLDDIEFAKHFLPESEDGVKATTVTGLQLPVFNVTQFANDDIMVADSIYQHKGMQRGKRVTPYFRHTMTKVEFNFLKGGPVESNPNASIAENVVLKSIEISGLKTGGELNVNYSTSTKSMSFVWPKERLVSEETNETSYFTYVPKTVKEKVTTTVEVPGEDGGDPTTQTEEVWVTTVVGAVKTAENLPNVKIKEGSIAVVGENVVYEYVSNNWVAATDNKYTVTDGAILSDETFVNYVTWYMIPQEIDGQVVTIKYEADGKLIEQDFALEVTNFEKDWTEETCVKYNVTIAPHKVVFNPTVTPWVPNEDINMNN